MKNSDIMDEIQNFTEHVNRTSIEVLDYCSKNQPGCSVKSMIRQIWEISFDTYVKTDGTELSWHTDEDTYGKIFDLLVPNIKKFITT